LIILSPESRLSFAKVESFANQTGIEIALSESAQVALADNHRVFCRLRDSGTPIYGITTGFGPFVSHTSGGGSGQEHAIGLLEHLGAGAGDPAPACVVKAAMLLRLQTFARAQSGINPEVAFALLRMLNLDAIPVVPSIGSLGASGDLVPLAHIARPLLGRGTVSFCGKILSGEEYLVMSGTAAVSMEPRDALALVNGTSFSTAYALHALARAWRLLQTSERLTALLFASLRCSTQPLHPALHLARGHTGQINSASAIRDEIAKLGGYSVDPSRPLQEIYSLRCAPQVLGACRSQLAYAQSIIDEEIHGVDDNPLILDPDAEHPLGQAVHGGNFHAQQVAFAADAINAALTQIGILAERQIDLIGNPQQNGGAPMLLARYPGRQSGLAGAQLTATALVSEMRGRCFNHATSSVPSNCGNQDIVPMAATAGRAAFAQTDHLSSILGIMALSIIQLDHLRKEGAAPGMPFAELPDFPEFTPLNEDRALHDVIARFARHFLNAA
jgi:histidine ammonia-lyase/tyrosine ammonia-lyase